MKNILVSAFLLACLLMVCVQCQRKDPKVGRPQFSLDAAGGGRNAKNFQMGYNAGVGAKMWESKNKDRSLHLGANYGRGIARVDGHTYKSKPSYGIGATFKWGKK